MSWDNTQEPDNPGLYPTSDSPIASGKDQVPRGRGGGVLCFPILKTRVILVPTA